MRFAHSGPYAFGNASLFWVLGAASLSVFACNSGHGKAPSPSLETLAKPLAPAQSRLSKADERLFFHLSQGSEFVPVCAIRLHQRERGVTSASAVAEYFERYGLISDPVQDEQNPLGLPIGVTLSEGRALAGFNCAACHVAKVPADARGPIIVGAPGHFDIRGFYDDLVPWLGAMLADHERTAQVLGCMVKESLEHTLASARAKLHPETHETAPMPGALDEDERQASREVAQLGSERGLSADSMPTLVEDSARFKSLSHPKRDNVVQSLRQTLSTQIRLLEARRASLANVVRVGQIEHTPPGPGRVDAFMTAINLLEQDTPVPMTSPVAYPPLWGIRAVQWLHYDGDTNASLQRNMGQALGVGGIFVANASDPKKIDATSVNPENLAKLERVLANINAPRWPFGAIDEKLAQRGKEIYGREGCGGCHDPDAKGALPELPFGPLGADQDPRTDSARIDNFDRLISGTRAIDFLAQRLDALAATAPPALRDDHPVWRATHRYAPRALAGVWATAPYLHNDSVPNLWALFSTERPRSFRVDYTHYDTKNVGYALAASGGFAFETSQKGNGSQGHPWGTQLKPDNDSEEKRALIEYLKQL